jgi:PadR family transcriptional regulator PadR
MTQTTQAVLRALLEQPSKAILARLENAEWLESWWEEADPREQGRPRRRYYRLSEDGAVQARTALARAAEKAAALRRLRPGTATGAIA